MWHWSMTIGALVVVRFLAWKKMSIAWKKHNCLELKLKMMFMCLKRHYWALQAKKTKYFVEDLHCVLVLLKKLKFDVPLTIAQGLLDLQGNIDDMLHC